LPETTIRRSAQIAEGKVHRRWDSLGDHGFGYLDSFGDTGATQVPRLPRMQGSTGTVGDPRWETLDRESIFCVFAVAMPTRMPVLDREGIAWFDDVLVLPPPGRGLRRPAMRTAERPNVALEEVLRELRAKAGLPVGDLAAMLGVSRRQFYNWVGREHEPDLEHDQRVRRTATLVERLHAHYREARLVRAALLASTAHGSAFDAFKANRLAVAEEAIEAAMIAGSLPDSVSPSQRLPFDRDRVLSELEHLRDAARGNG
jgi:hypothetical protein